MSTQIISSIINTPNLKALIIETYGSGNAPSDAEFIALLDEAIQKGIIILNVTQCKCGGSVEMSKYSAGLQLQQIGVLGGKDLTTEAAVTKLMFLLGLDLEREELERLITTPLCGEMAHS
jgi:L-asparaginase